MSKRAWMIALFALASAGGAVAVRATTKEAEAAPAIAPLRAGEAVPVDPAATPVLVELFTSEGCSSCPPADAVLARLERTQPVQGARIVPLGLHVDYWDRLGWTDPFSSERASARQRAYRVLGAGPYTPQAVIDGRAEAVGSRAGAVESAVSEAAKRRHATVAIEVLPPNDPRSRVRDLRIAVGPLPTDAAGDAELIIAVTQNGARVVVARGENGGSTLEHTAIVRDLVVAGSAARAGGTLPAHVALPSGAEARDLRIVAFVQERSSRRVLGTATRDLTTPPP